MRIREVISGAGRGESFQWGLPCRVSASFEMESKNWLIYTTDNPGWLWVLAR